MSAEFVSHIADVKAATDLQLAQAAEEIGQAAENNAKLHITEAVYQTPAGWYIRTGNLRNRITHETVKDDDSVTIVIGSEVEYAPYVELGTGVYAEEGGRQTPWRYQDDLGNWHQTSGMPARPFLRPAIEDHIQEYKQILESVISGS